MKLPINWLKKYIDIKLSPDQLAEKLTLSGSKVESVKEVSGDAVIDVEVTSNRPDCLSILGLAYEVSAFSGVKVKIPAGYQKKEKALTGKNKTGIEIAVEHKNGCPCYTARILRGLQAAPSTQEVQDLLAKAGTRAISNIVDVTNFVLYECGQPMHAFDLDKIRGGKIVVRISRENEKFLGIDGIEYVLDGKTLVIADAERVIAIAGVMGGKLTEVTGGTKNILLESAYFDPGMVRQAAKKYKITTESSYRFERGVNPENVSKASARASELLIRSAGGRDESGLMVKNYFSKKTAPMISLRMERMEKVLGLKVPIARAAQILTNLSFAVKRVGKDRLQVKPTPARRDVSKEIDLMEEILRIEGFDKVEHRLPPSRYTFEDLRDKKAMGLFRLKRYLSSMGFDEIMSYSLLSGKKLTDSGFEISNCHRVVNTTSAEQGYFRPSLLSGMLDAVLFNAYRKASSLKFFEIGNRYYKGVEATVLSLAFYGSMEENWARKNTSTFYDLKGAIENIFDYLQLDSFEWKDASEAWFDFGAEVLANGHGIGSIGQVSSAVLKRWDIPHEVFYAEVVLDRLFEKKPGTLKVKPVQKYPSVRRDIAFVIDNRFSIKELEKSMMEAGKPHLHQVALFDQFIGKNIPQGKRSIAFSLWYQKHDGTFTDEEIQGIQMKIGDSLKNLYKVEFR